MHVAELMTTDLTTVRDDTTVGDVVVALADAHVSAVPVVDARGRFVGVISTSDVLEAAAESGTAGERDALFSKTLAREIMSTQPKTIEPDDDVKQAAQEMLYLDVHRLFVEYDGELVGVISQSDIARALATAKI